MDLSLGVARLNIPNKQHLVVLSRDLELQDLNVHDLEKDGWACCNLGLRVFVGQKPPRNQPRSH